MNKSKVDKILKEGEIAKKEKEIDVVTGEVKEGEVENINKPIHLEKYFHMEKHNAGVQGIMYSEFGRSEMHTRGEWDILISNELKRELR